METRPALPIVLVVDDEPYIGQVVRRWLETEGYACESATSAEAALRRLEAHDVTLVLADLVMPGTGGLDLLRAIRHAHPQVPVVMMSGVSDLETADRALEAGACGYVTKPLRKEEVLISIANALEQHRRRQE